MEIYYTYICAALIKPSFPALNVTGTFLNVLEIRTPNQGSIPKDPRQRLHGVDRRPRRRIGWLRL